jgi:hypothetical protein
MVATRAPKLIGSALNAGTDVEAPQLLQGLGVAERMRLIEQHRSSDKLRAADTVGFFGFEG